jgi:hypothetical protein
MAKGTGGSALDRPAARIAAVVVCVAALGALGYIHRDDLYPPDPAAVADADDPFVKCMAERGGHIDKMQSEGTIRADQARLFRTRAEAMCRATTGGSAAPPPPRR